MKSHELTVKAMQQAQDIGPYNAISRALQEYGESVRQQAVKLIEDNWYKTQSDCAAAIEKMELP